MREKFKVELLNLCIKRLEVKPTKKHIKSVVQEHMKYQLNQLCGSFTKYPKVLACLVMRREESFTFISLMIR
jgi:hypothetical protein